MLQHAPLLHVARTRRATMLAEFKQLVRVVQHREGAAKAVGRGASVPSHSNGGRGREGGGGVCGREVHELLTWETYRWAAATVSTRSCHYPPSSPLAAELEVASSPLQPLKPAFPMPEHQSPVLNLSHLESLLSTGCCLLTNV